MSLLQIVFYVFSALLIVSALMVVTVRNTVKSVLFLILAFFSASALWITLQAEFLAIVLVLVYVGAVMVLFLFVVMMLDTDLARLRAGFTQHLPLGGLIAVVLMLQIAFILFDSFDNQTYTNPVNYAADYSNSKALGVLLYTDYLYAFEIAAILLLVAIITTITLTMRKRANTKYTYPGKQVKVKREDRLKIIKIPANKSTESGEDKPGSAQ